MTENKLAGLVVAALEDLKGVDIQCMDVRGVTSITDWMVIASGNSDRHVKALAENVLQKARDARLPILGVEGEKEAEWVLIDLGDVIAHVMLPRARDFYKLEKLWSGGEPDQRQAES
jgi:ribosome-associated protein